MKIRLSLPATLLILGISGLRAEKPIAPSVKVKPKATAYGVAHVPRDGSVTPDTDVIDAPTTAVLDNYGYSARSRFQARGGLLQYLSFGVYPGINLGASAAVDSLVGDERNVRMRAPTAQVKWRFYEGDSELPSIAVGFDGQGYHYNANDRRFNQRQRGFYIVATREFGAPGLELHPSFNVSDFDTNSVFGSLPLSIDIRDKASILLEWDNINNWSGSRFNAGLRAYLTPNFHLDFAVRAIGAGGIYGDGSSRGPERIVQIKYSNSL